MAIFNSYVSLPEGNHSYWILLVIGVFCGFIQLITGGPMGTQGPQKSPRSPAHKKPVRAWFTGSCVVHLCDLLVKISANLWRWRAKLGIQLIEERTLDLIWLYMMLHHCMWWYMNWHDLIWFFFTLYTWIIWCLYRWFNMNLFEFICFLYDLYDVMWFYMFF